MLCSLKKLMMIILEKQLVSIKHKIIIEIYHLDKMIVNFNNLLFINNHKLTHKMILLNKVILEMCFCKHYNEKNLLILNYNNLKSEILKL